MNGNPLQNVFYFFLKWYNVIIALKEEDLQDRLREFFSIECVFENIFEIA